MSPTTVFNSLDLSEYGTSLNLSIEAPTFFYNHIINYSFWMTVTGIPRGLIEKSFYWGLVPNKLKQS